MKLCFHDKILIFTNSFKIHRVLIITTLQSVCHPIEVSVRPVIKNYFFLTFNNQTPTMEKILKLAFFTLLLSFALADIIEITNKYYSYGNSIYAGDVGSCTFNTVLQNETDRGKYIFYDFGKIEEMDNLRQLLRMLVHKNNIKPSYRILLQFSQGTKILENIIAPLYEKI